MPLIPPTITSIAGSTEILPYWQSPNKDITLYNGDVCHVLDKLPSSSVHCVATSPPYWGLRDYGEEEQLGRESLPDCGTKGKKQCGHCFVCSMVRFSRSVKRVLREDGTFWLNLGDTYGGCPEIKLRTNNLVGIPWRVALALQNDGWDLRQDIIWSKPNPLTESLNNRCTKSHEYIFLFSRSEDYFYDNEPTKEEATPVYHAISREQALRSARKYNGHMPGSAKVGHTITGSTKNRRSVWHIGTQGFAGEHFAPFPEKLVECMLLAGTSEYGCCDICKKPYSRAVEKREDKDKNGTIIGANTTTVGWRKNCRCKTDNVEPCTVLDPFIGSGTTLVVAIQHGLQGIGVDLSREYLDNCTVPRIELALVGERYSKNNTAVVLQGTAPKIKMFPTLRK